MSATLIAQAGQWLARLGALAPGARVSPAEINAATDLAIDLLDTPRSDLVAALMQSLAARGADLARVWQLAALGHREEQQLEEAFAAIGRAAARDPASALIALARAQIAYESGRPSAELFMAALRQRKGDLATVQSAARALDADGDPAAARQLLGQALAARPEWIEGHKQLAALLTTSQGWAAASAHYARACHAGSAPELWLTWFYATAHTRDWAAARAILDEAAARLGTLPALDKARLYWLAESGTAGGDAALFDGWPVGADIGLDLARLRHLLRLGKVEAAAEIALAHRADPPAQAAIFWPYLSTCWRLLGDARAAWLDGDPPFITAIDLPFAEGDLDRLAVRLRELHLARAPFVEQSVRGGTQTSGPLLLRHESEFVALRGKILAAVRSYVDALPAPDPAHPLLGAPRGELLVEGSWSVRLEDAGFHTCHTHTHGWISSALYVALPDAAGMGAPPAGWISFGTPPPELGIELAPYRLIEPKPGRLALFPSTMWHHTHPFAAGERMTVAFDIRRPRR